MLLIWKNIFKIDVLNKISGGGKFVGEEGLKIEKVSCG